MTPTNHYTDMNSWSTSSIITQSTLPLSSSYFLHLQASAFAFPSACLPLLPLSPSPNSYSTLTPHLQTHPAVQKSPQQAPQGFLTVVLKHQHRAFVVLADHRPPTLVGGVQPAALLPTSPADSQHTLKFTAQRAGLAPCLLATSLSSKAPRPFHRFESTPAHIPVELLTVHLPSPDYEAFLRAGTCLDYI